MVRAVPGYALHHPNHPIEIRITRVPDSTPIPVPGPAPIDTRRHEITRSQVYGWRRDLKRKRLLPAAAPVCFVSLTPGSPDPDTKGDLSGPESIVEIVLRGGRLLRVPADLDDMALARLIRVTEAA